MEFGAGLATAARARGQTLPALVGEVDRARLERAGVARALASALRVFALAEAGDTGLPGGPHR